MPTPEQLAEQFEEHRPHVPAVAYRMLGSVSEAEDASRNYDQKPKCETN